MILDAGPKSVAEVEAVLGATKTLVWNGPFGAFELEPFDAATNAVARTAARLTGEGKLLSVAGGGDTVAALNHAGAADQVLLCLDRGRRLPRMAGRQGPAGRRGPSRLTCGGPPPAARQLHGAKGFFSFVRIAIFPKRHRALIDGRDVPASRVKPASNGLLSNRRHLH